MSGSGACRDNLDSWLDDAEINAPVPQETPARQQESLPFKLPLSVGRMPIHGSKIVDADGSLLVHDVYRHDIAEALVKATNRDPAFQKLVDAAELLISEIGGYQNVIQLEGFTKLREALRLAREGEK